MRTAKGRPSHEVGRSFTSRGEKNGRCGERAKAGPAGLSDEPAANGCLLRGFSGAR
jgi:hypothetical protein